VLVALSVQMENSANAAILQLAVGVTRSLQNEGVVPVVVVAVIPAQTLIDEDRETETVTEGDSDVQRRILMAAHRMVHPVEDKLAAGLDCLFVERAAAFFKTLRQSREVIS